MLLVSLRDQMVFAGCPTTVQLWFPLIPLHLAVFGIPVLLSAAAASACSSILKACDHEDTCGQRYTVNHQCFSSDGVLF